MSIPAETSVTFPGLDDLAAQVTGITTALADAVVAIEATTTAVISPAVYDPDTDLTAACAALVLAGIKEEDLRAPIQAAFDTLRDAVNVVMTSYDADPIV